MVMKEINNRSHIYLDNAATTPVRSEVIESMLPYWTQYYGNPSSVHRYGQKANSGLRQARMMFSELLNARADEIVFTGCGSESDNLALRGVMWAARSRGNGNHLIVSEIEHKAVLGTAKQLRDMAGFEISILPVNNYGQIDIADLETAIRPDTVLISIMAANNEIGSLQPIGEVGAMAKERGILFHTDAIQAASVTAWDMQAMPIDLLSLAPHKFYGPKGIGILYVRKGVELVSSLTGGGQESGLRSGTENVAFAVGAAEAFRLAMSERDENIAHYNELSQLLINSILEIMPDDCLLTGHPTDRLPNNTSFAFKNISGNDLILHLDIEGISASSGSACLTGDPQPSSVLKAIGLTDEWTKGGLRLTVGRQNSLEEMTYVIEILPQIVSQLRQLVAQFS